MIRSDVLITISWNTKIQFARKTFSYTDKPNTFLLLFFQIMIMENNGVEFFRTKSPWEYYEDNEN